MIGLVQQLMTVLIKLMAKYHDDFSDFGGLWYSEKLKAIWLDVNDGFEIETEEIVQEKFSKIPEIELVICECECSPNIFKDYEQEDIEEDDTYSDDWVRID